MKKKYKTCDKCKDRGFCSVPCEGLNLYLKSEGIYSSDWIRPKRSSAIKDGKSQFKEVPFSALTTEDKREFRHKYGDVDNI